MSKGYYYKFTWLTILSIVMTIGFLITFIVNYDHIDITDQEEIMRRAIKWQVQAKSVVGIPDRISSSYKNLLVDYSIAENNTNTLILGSSIAMGIRDYMFPQRYDFINGAKNGNTISENISEAEYYIQKYKTIKYVFISIDWGLGSPYREASIKTLKVVPHDDNSSNFFSIIKDAVSLPRVKIVLLNLKNDFVYGKKDFIDLINITYTCQKEDMLGIDLFKVTSPRICDGFRYDGSSTFSNRDNLSKASSSDYLTSKGTLKYRESLRLTKGVINPLYFDRIKKINLALEQRNGELVLLMPPILTGVVSYIKKSPEAPYLEQTLKDIETFTVKSNIKLLNASESEDYGCNYDDFFDDHHAYPSCYEKIFKMYFKNQHPHNPKSN